MTLTLKKLIKEAEQKLIEAQDARNAVITYLENEYELSYEDQEQYNYFEDECSWCYGFDIESIDTFIKEKERYELRDKDGEINNEMREQYGSVT